MVVELVGARIFAPTFGFSVVPWTSAIAAILLGVAAGNAWGGRRSRSHSTDVLRLLLFLSAAVILLPLVLRPLPDLSLAVLGVLGGSLASAVILFVPAAFLLGATGPFLVQSATGSLDEVGRMAGLLNGAHALGSILGTLLTGFVLIPAFPLSRILLVTGGTLCIAALTLRARSRPA